MKKAFLISFIVLSVFVVASCATTKATQKAGDYSLSLPEAYEYNTAESMNAEPGCVGVFTDPEKKLPELWVYSFNTNGRNLETFVEEKTLEFNADKTAVYGKYKVNGQNLDGAVIEFNENWYDTKYYNYYHIVKMDDGTFMCLDFACNPDVDAEASLKAVQSVLKHL